MLLGVARHDFKCVCEYGSRAECCRDRLMVGQGGTGGAHSAAAPIRLGLFCKASLAASARVHAQTQHAACRASDKERGAEPAG